MSDPSKKSRSKEGSGSDREKRRHRSSRQPRNPEHERPEGAYPIVIRNQALTLVYRRLILAAFMSVVAATVSVIVLMMVVGKPVPPQYIPVTEDGRLIPLIPLSKPNVDEGTIGEFALNAVRELNNYDYLGWKDQLPRAQNLFVPSAWKDYYKEFEGTNIIRTVLARKMIVVGQPTGDVKIENSGYNPQLQVFMWRVSVPIKINYVAHQEIQQGQPSLPPLSSEGTVTMFIQRVSPTLSTKGIAIASYQYAQKTSN